MTRAAKSSRAAYKRPRLGEKRKQRKPLRIDKLSAEVKSSIIAARDAGQTWKETADAASALAERRLSPTTVQRWYDIRIEQTQNGVGAIVPLLREIIDLLKSRLPAVNA